MLERAADQPLRLEHEILAGLQREVIREDMIQFAVAEFGRQFLQSRGFSFATGILR